ncbi:hypothetical protein BLA29_010971 [Euroglyphus maynei]|uniref:Integrase catalytic domain-containing protein n=1 Tax=Euroglyphus maynei TaxID=6958 RepID=A0A1Y3BJ71_EURMA|nr:hypothetical protein BLA29_010971 [Euroglyphus maynei]
MSDVMSLITSEMGNKYLDTLQDYCAKWLEALAARDLSTKCIIDWSNEIWNRSDIIHHRSTPYYHLSNGTVERTHHNIWKLLRVVVAESHQDLDYHWTSVLGVYRSMIHAALGMAPYEAMSGRPPEAEHEFLTCVKPRIEDESKDKRYLKNRLLMVTEKRSANTSDQLLKVHRDQIAPSSIELNSSRIHKRGRPRGEV